MNEADTRAELIDPQLTAAGWGVVEGSKVFREYYITAGKIQVGGDREKPLKADYVLQYRGRKLAAIEAKSNEQEVGEGVAQAKNYALRLELATTFAANGLEIYRINMRTGAEGNVAAFPSPQELWDASFAVQNDWQDRFAAVPFETIGGTKPPRYYQENAVNDVLDAVADNRQRILLTLATGTGKTTIAFHIAWKLFQTRWNLHRDGSRRPRILFLADRNILANQAFGEFTAYAAFKEDALVRISPNEVRKDGRVPTNGSIFFTIFQTFMSGKDKDGKPAPYFGQYPKDYFDFIIIDECHRGGANDEGNWRGILEYFSPAVQLGLTATPKRKDNVDTYLYFGKAVYTYSLKEGINDGFLTPFKVRRIKTTMDDYVYTSDDTVLMGEPEAGKVYEEKDFNRIIEIKGREKKRVQIYLDEANQQHKAIVFCANQPHAALIRDLINQLKISTNPNYCVRVTANDGSLGETYLKEFQDNEKTIPTVLTTSQKLSTGVDARNVRNIVLLRPVENMIEFKQIVGRGTRMFDGKNFFTIYDYVDAYKHFADPEWDGEPIAEECDECNQLPCVCESEPKYACKVCGQQPCRCPKPPAEPCDVCGNQPCTCPKKTKVKIKLSDGKERDIQHMASTSYWSADGRPISAEEFMQSLFGKLPSFFTSEQELRNIWSNPITRKTLLGKLADAGFGKDELGFLQTLVDAEKSDLFDVLEYISYSKKPITREQRVAAAQSNIFALLNPAEKEFVDFVLGKYIESGVGELDQEKLPHLLELKYQSISDAADTLGGVENIRNRFIEFQRHLYEVRVA
ncbi:MAG: DEAD/DEAH box helicase [Chitinophagaceae bacterium]|nr:MAG: DEAD/DEAH box helicase [Chitinophagaceae bacterium]